MKKEESVFERTMRKYLERLRRKEPENFKLLLRMINKMNDTYMPADTGAEYEPLKYKSAKHPVLMQHAEALVELVNKGEVFCKRISALDLYMFLQGMPRHEVVLQRRRMLMTMMVELERKDMLQPNWQTLMYRHGKLLCAKGEPITRSNITSAIYEVKRSAYGAEEEEIRNLIKSF